MRSFTLFVLLGVAFSAYAQLQQREAQITKKYASQLNQACRAEINRDQKIAKITSKQVHQICRCATPLAIKEIANASQPNTNLFEDILLIRFLECGSTEIQAAYSLDYRQRGLKIRGQLFEVGEVAGRCLAKLEYEATVDSVISKSVLSPQDLETQMLECVSLKY
jgi:hypothetical protein